MATKGLGKGTKAWSKHNASVRKTVQKNANEMNKEYRKLYGGSIKKW